MDEFNLMKKVLKDRLTYKRYVHCLGVSDTAVELAQIYKVSKRKAQIAGILHDYAKNLTASEARQYIKEFNIKTDEVIDSNINLAHGLIGAELVKYKFQIDDQDILDAIRYHTIGRKYMTDLDKIIYLADYIEPNRRFSGIEELRTMAKQDLNKAVLRAFDNSIKHVISKGLLLHSNSILARNTLIIEAA